MITIQPLDRKYASVLCKKTGNPSVEVFHSSTYNVMTVHQVAYITGYTVWGIESKLRNQTLTTTYPFRAGDLLGPKFVLRDAKFDRFIQEIVFKNG